MAMLLLAACSSSGSGSSAAKPIGGPGRLVAQPAQVDLGAVPFDVMKQATFELVNTGGAPVKIGKPQVKMLEGC